MTIIVPRASARCWASCRILRPSRRYSSSAGDDPKRSVDPRLGDIGRLLDDDFARLRATYDTPKNPIILAHGLLGFDELRLAGKFLPGVQYWRGITEALAANNIEVIVADVPASASIEERAEKLGRIIARKARGKSVNIVAHSMSGLDSRYMISRLKPAHVNVLSLTTIATPHRGSAFADYVFEQIGHEHLPRIYNALESLGMKTGAFSQLTRKYMQEIFNPKTPDSPHVRYFSYGAMVVPNMWSVFRQSQKIIEQIEGPNDGLVSVASSKWGGPEGYKGTLVGVSHLDLINWTNRLKWFIWELTGNRRNFNAIAFYLDIADMLAKEGL
ncbi:lipase [Xylona heveae TC161]|uniref:Lipase n=1 Tax=Xylona heveae (strain CBS 132557 / TC161) TaxID=1328760 RepID=A0A165I201_XYLHT|nr:lipase [Xylona heveae TC161]KZF24248.1 lipase [Xylona heveae TC161]